MEYRPVLDNKYSAGSSHQRRSSMNAETQVQVNDVKKTMSPKHLPMIGPGHHQLAMGSDRSPPQTLHRPDSDHHLDQQIKITDQLKGHLSAARIRYPYLSSQKDSEVYIGDYTFEQSNKGSKQQASRKQLKHQLQPTSGQIKLRGSQTSQNANAYIEQTTANSIQNNQPQGHMLYSSASNSSIQVINRRGVNFSTLDRRQSFEENSSVNIYNIAKHQLIKSTSQAAIMRQENKIQPVFGERAFAHLAGGFEHSTFKLQPARKSQSLQQLDPINFSVEALTRNQTSSKMLPKMISASTIEAAKSERPLGQQNLSSVKVVNKNDQIYQRMHKLVVNNWDRSLGDRMPNTIDIRFKKAQEIPTKRHLDLRKVIPNYSSLQKGLLGSKDVGKLKTIKQKSKLSQISVKAVDEPTILDVEPSTFSQSEVKPKKTRVQELEEKMTRLFQQKGLQNAMEWSFEDNLTQETAREATPSCSSSDSDKYVKDPYPFHFNSYKLREKSDTVKTVVNLLDLKNQPPIEKAHKSMFMMKGVRPVAVNKEEKVEMVKRVTDDVELFQNWRLYNMRKQLAKMLPDRSEQDAINYFKDDSKRRAEKIIDTNIK